MQSKRDGLVPVAEALFDLGGPVQALRDASPQVLHHFTRFDQVNQLVSASETTPDLGFMARLLALCSLPRSNPGNRLQYKRINGPFTLYMTASGGNKLPYGNLPRLILAWVCSEAVRTQSRVLVLGKSLSGFMRLLGVYSSSGEKHTRRGAKGAHPRAGATRLGRDAEQSRQRHPDPARDTLTGNDRSFPQ